MAGAHQKSGGLPFRYPEGDEGAAAPGQVILAPGDQLPAFPLRKAGVACRLQIPHKPGNGVVDAVGAVQKVSQFRNLFHGLFSNQFAEQINLVGNGLQSAAPEVLVS